MRQAIDHEFLESKQWKYMIFVGLGGGIIRTRIKPYGEGIPKYKFFFVDLGG